MDAVARVWKDEGPRVIGYLVRILRDVALAEELAQDALVAALEEWPRTGIPERPGAWLVTTARNRAFNTLKRSRVAARTSDALAHEAPIAAEPVMPEAIPDDALRLMFTACHPVLSTDARVALTLRLIGGLTTEEIARAFLTTETTIQQRIVRAKRTLAEAHPTFELPPPHELAERLGSVLEVIYLIFNEGYTATAGSDLMRPALAAEAIRIATLLAQLAPDEPEVFGLLALMQLHASRSATRVDADGEPVLLVDQDRARWDRTLIADGLAALARANRPGPYQLQAAIAACHATAPSIDATDWRRIAELYGELAQLRPSPVIELNRAMAISRADGPAKGLALVDKLRKPLADYALFHAARAELLHQLGRGGEARAAYERAAELTTNERQQARLRARAAACGD
ncbi:MAG: sigma-70 family RNA polymerase sigma factor [Deltaproteobacteria bacterium]|nr:sigma-70 family RNA polymerase sigma factor [Deltaproteobacteria bacterium]